MPEQPPPGSLTDRDLVARALRMAVPVPMDVIRERTGETDTVPALLGELASVRHLLAEVAGRLERLGGS